jgi:hypothetical protein
MVGSNKTDPSLGTVNILHEGPEECKFLTLLFLCKLSATIIGLLNTDRL